MSDGAYSGANLMNYVELCETRIRGLEEANGLMAQAAAEDGARIRLLEQQLSTAREEAFEEAAQVAERDVDWSAFGKAAIEPWEKGQDSLRDYRLGIVVGRAIAAAIRSLGEKE